MIGRHRMSAGWALGVGAFAVAAAGVAAGAGLARAQPVPVDPVVPQIPGVVTSIVTADGPLPLSPPPPPGAPTVPAIPPEQLQQSGDLGSLGDIFGNFRSPNDIATNLFPDPVVPYTPARQMPMGPPPPPDPAFAPPP
jgi:hypothetical protein